MLPSVSCTGFRRRDARPRRERGSQSILGLALMMIKAAASPMSPPVPMTGLHSMLSGSGIHSSWLSGFNFMHADLSIAKHAEGLSTHVFMFRAALIRVGHDLRSWATRG
jgi:hypothetical protein